MPEAKLTSSQAFPRVVPPSSRSWTTLWECDEEIKHNLGVKNASKWCSYLVREAHTLYSNEKCRNIWKFVILKLKSTDTVFNGTKIKLNLFDRTSEHQNSFRPSASQSVSSTLLQCYPRQAVHVLQKSVIGLYIYQATKYVF